MHLQEIADFLQGANVSSSFFGALIYLKYMWKYLHLICLTVYRILASMLLHDPFTSLLIYFLQINDSY